MALAFLRFCKRMWLERKPHWTHTVGRLDFRSGLGDSAWLLYGICRSLKPNIAVEIGSARGKSACFIGMALKENGFGHLYAIDPHTLTEWNDNESIDTREVMRRHLKELALQKVVTIIPRRSDDQMVKLPSAIDLLFIDGDHSYEGVKADWSRFVPRMSQFGVVVFHDTIWKKIPDNKWYRHDIGVPRFVEELRQHGYPVLTLDRDYGLSIVQAVRGGIRLSCDLSSN